MRCGKSIPGKTVFLLARKDNKIVGVVFAAPKQGDSKEVKDLVAEIDKLYVVA